MKYSELNSNLPLFDDIKLYNIAFKFLFDNLKTGDCDEMIHELIFDECKKRDSDIYEKALNDAEMAILFHKNSLHKAQLNLKRAEFLDRKTLKKFSEHNQFNFIDSNFSEDIINNTIEKEINVDIDNILIIEVDGDSMKNAGFDNGDKMVVDTLVVAKSDNIVIAQLNGKLFVKRFKIINGESWLYPENPAYNKYKIKSTDDFTIVGVVKNIIKKIA